MLKKNNHNRNSLALRVLSVPAILLSLMQTATADVSGNWIFVVDLGEYGSGDATITLTEGTEGKLSGIYTGQLSDGPFLGTHEDNNFQFSVDGLLGEVVFKGQEQASGRLEGVIESGDEVLGSFTGREIE